MLAGSVDHLWQSLQFSGAACALAWLAGGNAAIVRLWLYRIAAWKFAVPFHVVSAVGYWYGFPVKHPSEAPPADVIAAVTAATPFFSPVHSLGVGTPTLWLLLLFALAVSAAALRWIRHRYHHEDGLVHAERRRLERDPDDRQPGLGFLKGLAFTALAIAVVIMPLTGGAIAGSLHRRDVLIANALVLREAPLRITPAAPGMGTRHRVSADVRGVLIRNATIRDLAALAYGVHPASVHGNHFVASGQEDWLTGSRHDVYVTGKILEPERFDAYSLRQALTKLLARQFGLEVYVNSACQPPCGKWNVALNPEPL